LDFNIDVVPAGASSWYSGVDVGETFVKKTAASTASNQKIIGKPEAINIALAFSRNYAVAALSSAILPCRIRVRRLELRAPIVQQ
jgi:hypothetical protein